MKYTVRNIKIKFAGKCAILADAQDSKTLDTGVRLWLKKRGPCFIPMAEIPDGTLEQYKHDRPVVLSQDWVEA